MTKKIQDKHYRRKCVICGRMQLMRKNQKACSGKRFGWQCAVEYRKRNSTESPERRREILIKAAAVSAINREKRIKEFIESFNGMSPYEIYQLGYGRGYDMGYFDRKLDGKGNKGGPLSRDMKGKNNVRSDESMGNKA